MQSINFRKFIPLIVTMMFYLIWGNGIISAQNDANNLAVYVTGTQNDQKLSISLQSMVENRTIIKLSTEENFHLIERYSEFIKQIQNEQTSGYVSDGKIAEVGLNCGAKKICVVNVTINNKYLYINARMVDVVEKNTVKSAVAELKNYNSIPQLTQILDTALNNMLASTPQAVQNTVPIAQKETTTDKNSSKVTGGVTKSQKVPQKPAEIVGNNTKADMDVYMKRLRKEKGGFLDMNSLAYQEYSKYHKKGVAGGICLGMFSPVFITGVMMSIFDFYISGAVLTGAGVALLISGIVELGTRNKHLQKSYQYYIGKEKKTATLSVHPYFGFNNTIGTGLTLRF